MAKAKKTAAKKKTTKATKATKPRAKKAAPKDVLLVGSKVRNAIKEAGMNTGGDAIEGLNDYVYWLVNQATQRAQANNRKTVRKHDFVVQ